MTHFPVGSKVLLPPGHRYVQMRVTVGGSDSPAMLADRPTRWRRFRTWLAARTEHLAWKVRP